MRRSRRGRGGMEFGGSGEDSFVAVVVTKLTGALLFILLLTMVIMALLPKAIDLPSSPGRDADAEAATAPRLVVTTPEDLPEAIAGRPYRLAFAADNGRGHLRWSLTSPLPEGLSFVPETGTLVGTPTVGKAEPVPLFVSVEDGRSRASRATRLVVYKSDVPLTTPSTWKPSLPPIPWRDWLDQGFGFLVLWLVYLVGIGVLDAFGRRAIDGLEGDEADAVARRTFGTKVAFSLLSLAATAGLAAFLWWPRR